MRKVDVRAYEDHAHPEGGHAVIVVSELDGLPESASFLLKSPDDAPGAEPLEGWPHGHHLPLETRSAPDGAELVIGPDITDSHLLLPGTIVRIEIPAADVWGELVWPNVSPTRRPRRRNLIVNRNARAARAGVMLPPEPEQDPDWTEAAPVAEADATGAAAYADRREPEAVDHVGVAQRSYAVYAEPRRDDVPRAAASIEEEVVVVDEERFAPRHIEPDHEPAYQQPPRAATIRDDDAEAYAGEATLSRLLQHEEVTRPRIGMGRPAASFDPPASPYGDPGPTTFSQQESSSRGWSRRAMEPDYQPASAGRTISGKALLGAGLAAVLGAIATLFVFAPDRLPGLGLRGGKAQTVAGVYGSGETAAADEDTPDALFEALAVGTVSPRGVPADLPLGRVLENANKNAMTSGTQADRDEGAFWRKRYVVGALGNDRTKKALTQLGSLYAEPSGQTPDYSKARLLWEVASAAGDPVAMCFLGQLYESGLSVAADRKNALQWYERAKTAGGCPSVDESIARVRQ